MTQFLLMKSQNNRRVKMKLNKTYQSTLAARRQTNLIHSSWSVFYKGEYVCGAVYNGESIMSVCFPCGLVVLTKSLDIAKKYIRDYKAGSVQA
jgi:hypothetical protein